MDGSDIDWEALDHELDNMEAEPWAFIVRLFVPMQRAR